MMGYQNFACRLPIRAVAKISSTQDENWVSKRILFGCAINSAIEKRTTSTVNECNLKVAKTKARIAEATVHLCEVARSKRPKRRSCLCASKGGRPSNDAFLMLFATLSFVFSTFSV